jgi:hypothetical protein
MQREVTFSGTVIIEIDERYDDVITRCTENIDGWRDNLYDLRTEEQVLRHLAANCVANGVEDAFSLDGWADLLEGMVTMTIDRQSLDFD